MNTEETHKEISSTASLENRIQILEGKIEALTERTVSLESNLVSDRLTLVLFSDDMDKQMAGFIIATGAAAMGMKVSMFFTYWGLTALRKRTILSNKTLPEKLVALMLPPGPHKVATSKMNMLGIGPEFFKHLMKKKNVQTLPELIALAKEMDVNMIACQMSMEIMGISKDELLDDLSYGGVATYIEDASDSKVTLFI